MLSVDKSPIDALGRATINVHIEETNVNHNALKANISNKGLLGLNFLQAHGMAIDFAQGMAAWGGEQLATQCRMGYEQVCRVQLVVDVVIPAGTRTLVPSVATKHLVMGDWIIEPPDEDPRQLPILAGKNPDPRTRKNVHKPTDKDVSLLKNTNVGVIKRSLKAEVTEI